VLSASVDNVPKTTKRKKLVDASVTALLNQNKKAQPDCTKACTTWFNRIASLPRWMKVTDIDRQDRSRYNTERVLNQDFHDRININKKAEELNISVEEAESFYLQDKEFEKTSLAYQFRLGHPLMSSEREVNDLPTNMRQLHQYSMADSMSQQYTGFEALIVSGVVLIQPEETLHHIRYDCLF
jgi:hypothetical protein